MIRSLSASTAVLHFVCLVDLAPLAFGLQLPSTMSVVTGGHASNPGDDLWSNIFTNQFPARGDPLIPRMLTMRGCSGSSAIMVHARRLLRYHGIPVKWGAKPNRADGKPIPPSSPSGWPDEMLNPNVNWFYEPAGNNMGKALKMAAEEMRRQNQTLFFKGMVQHLQGDREGNDEWDELKPALEALKIRAVIGTRQNVLDQVVCQIRDCFQADYGHPVDSSTGERSELCFKRRSLKLMAVDAERGQSTVNKSLISNTHADAKSLMFRRSSQYKAHVNASHLLMALHLEQKYLRLASLHLGNIGLNASTVYAEDLLEFQTGMPGAQTRAFVAWCTFLRSLGVDPDTVLLRQYLEHFSNTYPEQAPHRDVIHNFDEVQQVLTASQYGHFLRY